MREIKITDFSISKHSGDTLELIYIPAKNQILRAGEEYKITFHIGEQKDHE